MQELLDNHILWNLNQKLEYSGYGGKARIDDIMLRFRGNCTIDLNYVMEWIMMACNCYKKAIKIDIDGGRCDGNLILPSREPMNLAITVAGFIRHYVLEESYSSYYHGGLNITTFKVTAVDLERENEAFWEDMKKK